jgi:hypothetical protein
MARQISCQIRSFTHELSQEAFKTLKQNASYIDVANIQGDSFEFIINDSMEPSSSDNEFSSSVHAVFNVFIVALNVATLGLFINYKDNYLSPVYTFQRNNTEVSSGFPIQEIHTEDFSGRNLTYQDIEETLILFGALSKEKNTHLISEYLKGLIHLGLNYPGVHFEKDAFSNFYRVFEHVATSKILKQNKLSNEFKQLSKALTSLGLDEELVNEFRTLYKIRCAQAMHSQKPPSPISRENTMKMKILTDTVMSKAYKVTWYNHLKSNNA